MNVQYILCADGACSGNPGPGGFAWELWEFEPCDADEGILLSGSGRAPDTTNNIMELAAAIDAIQCINKSDLLPGTVLLRLDSEYVLNGIFQWMENWKKKGWKTASKKPVKNKELWLLLDQALEQARERGFVFQNNWVKGHNSDIGNERVDTLAVEERDKASSELHHCDQPQDDVAFMLMAKTPALTAAAQSQGLEVVDMPMSSVSPEDLRGGPDLFLDELVQTEVAVRPRHLGFDSPHCSMTDLRRTMETVDTEQEQMYPSQVDLMRSILDLYASGDYSVKKALQEIRANKTALGL